MPCRLDQRIGDVRLNEAIKVEHPRLAVKHAHTRIAHQPLERRVDCPRDCCWLCARVSSARGRQLEEACAPFAAADPVSDEAVRGCLGIESLGLSHTRHENAHVATMNSSFAAHSPLAAQPAHCGSRSRHSLDSQT